MGLPFTRLAISPVYSQAQKKLGAFNPHVLLNAETPTPHRIKQNMRLLLGKRPLSTIQQANLSMLSHALFLTTLEPYNMESDDPEFVDFFVEHLDAIDFEKTRLSYPSRPIVIFCGGEVGDNQALRYEEIEENNFRSFRQCLKQLYNQYYPSYLFYTPEEVDWRNGLVFADLLEFEIAFSHLSTVIAIIAETPSSLVELGMFSSDKLNEEKVLIIAETKFSESNSFINKGVFEYIRKTNNDAVKFFPLESYRANIDGSEPPVTISRQLAKEVFEEVNIFIEERLKKKTCRFDIKNKTHFFSLLIDTMNLFRVISKEELVEVVEYLNLHLQEDFFKENDVKQFLMLMRELGFVRLHTKGSNRFYHLNNDLGSISRVTFSYKKEKSYDKTRKMSQIIDFYKEKSKNNKFEEYKLRAIEDIYGQLGNGDELW